MSASCELQKVIHEALVADAAVGDLIGDRIYDDVPEDRTFPYISFGPTDSRFEDLTCITARTETVQLDVWCRDNARLRPCKEVCDAVKNALHLADLSLTVNALVQVRVEGMRVFMDRDGLTAHGVITVEADLEEN